MKRSQTGIKPYYGVIIQVSFVMIAVLYGSLYFFYPHILTGDNIFNYLRFKEVSEALAHTKFPQFSWYTGTFLGGAVNSFYPWGLMLPLILLLRFVPPVTWWGIMICTGMLLGLEVTYFSVLTLHKGRKQALLMTLFYCLSTIPAFEAYWGEDFGSYYGLFLAPMVIVGWLHWIDHGRWHLMAAGMILLIFTHLATIVVLAISLPLMTLCFYHQLDHSRILNGIKAVAVFIVCGAVVWVPIVYLRLTNRILVPHIPFPGSIQPLIFKSWTTYLTPFAFNSWDSVDLLAIVFAVIYHHYLRSIDRKFVLISLVILLMNVKPVQWFLVYHTFLGNLQFMFRFSFVSHFLLSGVLARIVSQVLPRVWHRRTVVWFASGLLAFMIIILAVGIFERQSFIASRPRFHQAFNFQRDYERSYLPAETYSNRDLESNRDQHDLYVSYADYYPDATTESRKGFSQKFLKLSQPNQHWYTPGNVIRMDVQRNGRYHVPAVMYNGQQYQVVVNHRSVRPRNDNHYMILPLRRGKNVISFDTPLMWYRKFALVASIMGIRAFIVWDLVDSQNIRERKFFCR